MESEVLLSYIQKLSHPLKEIRERSLQLLLGKLKLGWELNDELEGTRQVLESTLAWLQAQQPTLQREALDLLLIMIKTEAGTYIAKEFGVSNILSTLNKIKNKIDSDAHETYEDVMETLKFLNTISSAENVTVPQLLLHDLKGSESEGGSTNAYYKLGSNFGTSSESSSSKEQYDSKSDNGVKILLFPWVDLSPSDIKTMQLVEDALRLLKSTRRCCRFVCDVFLRDFPAEIFLNYPQIIHSLLSMAEGNSGGRPVEALHVLLCLTNALSSRLLQLLSLDLIHDNIEATYEHKHVDEGFNTDLECITGENYPRSLRENDGLAPLRQLPAPIYALDTLQTVLSIMARDMALNNHVDNKNDFSSKELNICLHLVEALVELLLDCVSASFWTIDHSLKIHRDISHKSCMVMRLIGDLLMKYRRSFFEDTEKTHIRIAWLRLINCAANILHWCRDSALPPSSIVVALQTAQLDPALDLFYLDLNKKIAQNLENSKIKVDQEYKTKYTNLMQLYSSMISAVRFIKNKSLCCNSKKVLPCLKLALPALELIKSNTFLDDIADVLLNKTKYYDMNDSDWSIARNIALALMAHNAEWICSNFYKKLAATVMLVLYDDGRPQQDTEKSLTLLCDVGVLTEICCHGLSSKHEQVKESASEIMLYLLRGRLMFSESSWWRLLASLLPVLPLLHVYAAHETQLGQAICKSLDRDIADCMGMSTADIVTGLIRLLFVRCVAVQLDAAHSLCQLLDDDKYLPPRESLRADILLGALRRIQPQDFNIDVSSCPSETPQTTALVQILDVLKQDIVLDEDGSMFPTQTLARPTLDPTLRRSTLQQLSVILRHQETHETFLQCDGLNVIIATLRMSLLVDDYLAFPECGISCVSILNSICFSSRHTLAKIPDLPSLLIRVILVFPANDSAVLMSAQVLALVAWAGFALQEMDLSRKRIPALPLCVTQRTSLPFNVNSYWNTSSNSEHSYIEWLMAEEEWRTAIRIRWWWLQTGRASILLDTPIPDTPLSLQPCARDLAALRASSPLYCSTKALLALENATSHAQVIEALNILESYTHLVGRSSISKEEYGALPWHHLQRFLSAPPASHRDTTLLVTLLHFIVIYMDKVPDEGATKSWIKSHFIDRDVSIISLLGREELQFQQSTQEDIEVTQLQTYIVKVLLRCIIFVEKSGDYDKSRMESLVKILVACLDRIDLTNFHKLGYLNELMRCVRYALNSRYCNMSHDTIIYCLNSMTQILIGCASGAGRKGQACRLDAMLSLLALLRYIYKEAIPVQRWSEACSGEVVRVVIQCSGATRVELRAAAIHVTANLAHYPQLLPHLVQAIEEESLCCFALRIFSQRGEANVVRTAAASLLTAITSRVSSRCNALETEVLQNLKENHFLENCLDIFGEFCTAKEYKQVLEPNVSISLLERRSELEVRAQKYGDVRICPSMAQRDRSPAASLVTSLSDVLNNISGFNYFPVQEWNDKGLYRLLFRCTSWSRGESDEIQSVRGAACRALFAVTSHKCVLTTLANTKDCLHNLVQTLTLLKEDEKNTINIEARTQALLLVASLLVERTAAETVWTQLRESSSPDLFLLVHQCLDSDELELQNAGIYCLSELIHSATVKKHGVKKKDESYIELYDRLQSPFANNTQSNDMLITGAGYRKYDCQPDYMAEELCKSLINLYQRSCLEIKKNEASQDEHWISVSSCLSCVLAASPRSRVYALHRRLPRILLTAMQALRDHLSMLSDPVEVIRNNNRSAPLRTMYWLLTIINCIMVDCIPSKEYFAEEGLSITLLKLWPWFMLTDQLRQALVNLIHTFTNNCSNVYGGMCACVGGRTLVGEVCALVVRQAPIYRSSRPQTLLTLALHILRHCLNHHHCRTILIKSDALSSVYKMCVRERIRGACAAGEAWCRLMEALSRHGDGAQAVLVLVGPKGALYALPNPLRAKLMPAIANAAHHHRVTFLQSRDLLELLTESLLAGDTDEIICASRAVWALASNNHKAKLLLRSAGVAAAVLSALQKLERNNKEPATRRDRALQLLTYTNTVLQTT